MNHLLGGLGLLASEHFFAFVLATLATYAVRNGRRRTDRDLHDACHGGYWWFGAWVRPRRTPYSLLLYFSEVVLADTDWKDTGLVLNLGRALLELGRKFIRYVQQRSQARIEGFSLCNITLRWFTP
jgi:hypothetical protein